MATYLDPKVEPPLAKSLEYLHRGNGDIHERLWCHLHGRGNRNLALAVKLRAGLTDDENDSHKIRHKFFKRLRHLLRSDHDALLEDQRPSGISPHLTSRRASDLFRLAPTHLHLLLGHSRVDLSFLDRRPYVCSPFVFQPEIFGQKVVLKPAQMSDLFLDVRSTQIQVDEALFAGGRFELRSRP